jgi:hypothetical protein
MIWLAVCHLSLISEIAVLTKIPDVGGTKGVSRVQSVKDGALLTFEMRSWADDPNKPSLDPGHKGPCAFYLKKVDSAINDKGAGDGWFKIFDHGYDSGTSKWCTEKLIDNKGLFSVNLPKGLEGGYYLARPELLALHAVAAGDPQFYTGCAQIFLESSGNLGPDATVSIPGYVDYNQPATSFNIYDTDASKYTTLPGPPVAKLVAKSDMSIASSSQTEGTKPDGCIVENTNWCGKEVPSYSDETGCWASSKLCWDQQKSCYDAAGPTGAAGCKIWDAKCEAINDACNSKNFNGPPNKGKVLTPENTPIDVGLVMATVGGGTADYTQPKTSATQQAASKTDTPAKATSSASYSDDDYSDDKDVVASSTPAASPAKATSSASYSDDDYSDDKDVVASSTPASSPAKTTFAIAPKPTVTGSYQATPDASKDDAPSDDNKPAYTITVPPSSPGAPAPTKAPESCPKGYKCVTVTDVETVTQTVYVTAAADSYKRAVGGFRQRRRHAHHL